MIVPLIADGVITALTGTVFVIWLGGIPSRRQRDV